MKHPHTLAVRLVLGAVIAATVVSGCRSGGAGVNTGAVAMSRTAEDALPGDITPAMIALGDSLFHAGSCQRCHGAAGVGATNGPTLTTGAWLHVDGSFARLVSLITTGVPRDSLKVTTRRPMNPRGGPMNLTDAQVRAVAGYVFTISRGKR